MHGSIALGAPELCVGRESELRLAALAKRVGSVPRKRAGRDQIGSQTGLRPWLGRAILGRLRKA